MSLRPSNGSNDSRYSWREIPHVNKWLVYRGPRSWGDSSIASLSLTYSRLRKRARFVAELKSKTFLTFFSNLLLLREMFPRFRAEGRNFGESGVTRRESGNVFQSEEFFVHKAIVVKLHWLQASREWICGFIYYLTWLTAIKCSFWRQ